jgi:hypothetical protein
MTVALVLLGIGLIAAVFGIIIFTANVFSITGGSVYY